MLFTGYGTACTVICDDGLRHINQLPAHSAACIVIDTHVSSQPLDKPQRLESPCPSMRSSAFFQSCYRSVTGSVIANIALKGADAAAVCNNAQVSRCNCPASCCCLQPAMHLHRGCLLLHLPHDAHVMLLNTGSTGSGNIVLIASRLPVRETHISLPHIILLPSPHSNHPLPPLFQVDNLTFGANATVQHHGLTLHDESVIFCDLPCRAACGFARCELR